MRCASSPIARSFGSGVLFGRMRAVLGPADLIAAGRLLVDAFRGAGAEFRKAFAHSVVYLVMFLLAWFTYNLVREHFDFTDALDVAFFASNESLDAKALLARARRMQDELQVVAAADRRINQVLQSILARAPLSSRARLAIIHNGVTGITGISMLYWDISHAQASPGRSVGELVQNQPLSEMTDYLSVLLADKCVSEPTASLTNQAARARLADLNVSWFMACPSRDIENQMLGVIFLSWDGNDRPPQGAAIAEIEDMVMAAGRQIGAVLDVRQIGDARFFGIERSGVQQPKSP